MLINKIEKKENGFSLVELLAVVGIGGALIAGALLLVNDVNAKKDIKQHSENISAIYANMSNLFSDEDITTSNADLVIAGVFPSTLKINSAGTSVKTSGGGEITIVGLGDDGYNLNYPKIKRNSCVEVIKNQKRIGWDKWGIKNGNTDVSANLQFSDSGASSVSKIAVACRAGDSDWVSLGFSIE